LEQLEKNLSGMGTMTQLLNQGLSPQDITSRVLEGLGVAPGQQTVAPRWAPGAGLGRLCVFAHAPGGGGRCDERADPFVIAQAVNGGSTMPVVQGCCCQVLLPGAAAAIAGTAPHCPAAARCCCSDCWHCTALPCWRRVLTARRWCGTRCRYGPCEPEALKQRMVRAVAALGEQEVGHRVHLGRGGGLHRLPCSVACRCATGILCHSAAADVALSVRSGCMLLVLDAAKRRGVCRGGRGASVW